MFQGDVCIIAFEMNKIVYILAFFILAVSLSACIAMGKGSHKVKYDGYYLSGDGNDNDSAFFYVSFKNKSDYPLVEPNLMVTVKDTSDKTFKKTIWTGDTTFADQAANSNFTVKLYAEDFYFTDEVGKVKFFLSWTNKKGKGSFRRRIVYE